LRKKKPRKPLPFKREEWKHQKTAQREGGSYLKGRDGVIREKEKAGLFLKEKAGKRGQRGKNFRFTSLRMTREKGGRDRDGKVA